MRAEGAAGGSALAGYREELRSRRAAGFRCAVSAAAAAGLGWVALHLGGNLRTAAITGAALALLCAVWMRPRPDPERWLRAAAGEAATARLLDRLPARRWVVIHDLGVPGSRSNIDHLVIGPTGVWVVDTKTTRGPARRGLRGLSLGDRRLDTGPVRFEASVVEDHLGVEARPVVAVHGARLPKRGVLSGGVRVVPADALVGLLKRGSRLPWLRLKRRHGRTQILQLAHLAESRLPPAGCSSPNGGWYRSKRDPREAGRKAGPGRAR